MSSCLNCKNFTNNPKFCSKKCAAILNNKNKPKRKPEGSCKNCNKSIKKSRSYCKDCFSSLFNAKDMTLHEAIYTKHHRSSAYSLIRARARLTNKIKNAKCCEKCGYDKHIEACHIKSISSFSNNTLISEINHDQNLMALCPNCHWEFDHGLFKL